MYFLLSGEGPTDIGLCTYGMNVCEGNDHEQGPMAVIASQIVEQQLGFSFMDTSHYGYVSKTELVSRAQGLKQLKKKLILPGKKRPKESGYFYKNARSLALCAQEKAAAIQDKVVAILFRDSDGTASADRGHWTDKRNSIIRGFLDEGFAHGVPMIPKPKSEAWVICSIKQNPYKDCRALEDCPGNDKSPKSLKKELAAICGQPPSRDRLCEMVNNKTIDYMQIDMPSFLAFKDALLAAIGVNPERP